MKCAYLVNCFAVAFGIIRGKYFTVSASTEGRIFTIFDILLIMHAISS